VAKAGSKAGDEGVGSDTVELEVAIELSMKPADQAVTEAKGPDRGGTLTR